KVNVNGQVALFPLAWITSVTVYSGVGQDKIYVNGTAAGKPLTVNAGTGQDEIQIGGGNPFTSLDPIQGQVTVEADGGNDTLIFNDLFTLAGHDYLLGANILKRSGAADVNFNDVEKIILNATQLDDTIGLPRTLSGTNTIVNAGAGADVIT